MMKFICAPDSFKESMTAVEAATSMARGIRDVLPGVEVDRCPISDGGEGFAVAVAASLNAKRMTTRVTGPLGERCEVGWLFAAEMQDHPATAVIEMAAASGLELLAGDQRDPTKTTTYGTGELIAAALDQGARRIVLGIGGSATNDFGCGAAQALGARFLDQQGHPLPEPVTGGHLERIEHIELSKLHEKINGVEMAVACDVKNPLTGCEGAARVYAAQKGATHQQVLQLDRGLRHMAQRVRQQLGQDIEHQPGAGAAGGMGGGAMVFFNAALKPGIDLVLETVRFGDRVKGCRLCLTGEGKLDGQSLAGKACLGVAKAAKQRGVATYALVGAVGDEVERALQAGLAGYRVIGPGIPERESIRRGPELLRNATARLMRELRICCGGN